MPTYSYRCRDCDTAFDVHQSFTDDSLTECPTCHGSLRKVFSPVGVVFKGSGFYRTDSARSNGARGGSAEKSSESSGSSESSSSSDSSSSKKTADSSGGSSSAASGSSGSSKSSGSSGSSAAGT